MTSAVFDALEVYEDRTPRSAAMNMAIDEALLELSAEPTLRIYRWDHPALSFGYFGRFSDVAEHESKRDLVRRWTGGGIVLHGDDLTYSLIVPAKDVAFAQSSLSIYATIHRAIQEALIATGKLAHLALRESPKVSESCFANPVRADVLVGGRKVAGAAQRRTRHGLLQQGSIQEIVLAENFATEFSARLSANCRVRRLDDAMVERAGEIAGQKYGTVAWLRRR
jgi:lipoate-protein ligase A